MTFYSHIPRKSCFSKGGKGCEKLYRRVQKTGGVRTYKDIKRRVSGAPAKRLGGEAQNDTYYLRGGWESLTQSLYQFQCELAISVHTP